MTNSKHGCETGVTPFNQTGHGGSRVVLEIRGMSHVPSFKNMKRAILDRSSGKMRTLTDPKAKLWMERAIKSFVSQLYSKCPITGPVTLMEDYRQFVIASLPPDDNWKVIPEINIKAQKVKPGEEGCTIIIEPIT